MEHRYEGTPTRSHYTVQWVSVPANLLMENGYARHRCVCTAVCVCVRAWERLNRSMCWLRVADFGVNDWNLVRWDARISVFCGKDEWKVERRCLRWRVSILKMGGEKKSDGIFLRKNAVHKYKAEEKNEIDSRGVFTHKTKRFRAEVRRKNIFAGWKRGEAFDMEIQKHKKHEKMVKKIFMLIMGRMKK